MDVIVINKHLIDLLCFTVRNANHSAYDSTFITVNFKENTFIYMQA